MIRRSLMICHLNKEWFWISLKCIWLLPKLDFVISDRSSEELFCLSLDSSLLTFLPDLMVFNGMSFEWGMILDLLKMYLISNKIGLHHFRSIFRRILSITHLDLIAAKTGRHHFELIFRRTLSVMHLDLSPKDYALDSWYICLRCLLFDTFEESSNEICNFRIWWRQVFWTHSDFLLVFVLTSISYWRTM